MVLPGPAPAKEGVLSAAKRRETDLHEPIRLHLERLGFEVQGEVGRCDIVVSFGEEDSGLAPRVEIAFHPLPYDRKKQSRRRRAVIRELDGRSDSYNRGGSTQRKLMTAYRENAVRIACLLARDGPMAPRRLRDLDTGEKTQSILSSNHYGWFERIERGVYDVSAEGRKALEEFPDLVKRFAPAKGDGKA